MMSIVIDQQLIFWVASCSTCQCHQQRAQCKQVVGSGPLQAGVGSCISLLHTELMRTHIALLVDDLLPA
jgi:hypothetical protein